MKFKGTTLLAIIVVFFGLFVSEALANNCPTSNPATGVGCTLDNQNYFCNNTCQLNSNVPSCSIWTPTPIIAPNYAITQTASVSTDACLTADACGVCASCNTATAYKNKCGTYPNIYCKANFTPVSGDVGYVANCGTYNACTEKCSACSSGYSLCTTQNKCTLTLPCPGQTFNVCTGLCEGDISTVKLDYDSGGTSAGTTIKQSAFTSPIFNISANSLIGVGTSTPTTVLTFGAATGNQIDVSGGHIIGLSTTPTEDSEAVPLLYLQNNYAPLGSGEGGIGIGVSGQTLRHDGTSWVANSTLFNNGTNIGIGTTNPSAKLELSVGNVDGINIKSSNSGFIRLFGGGATTNWGIANDYTAGNYFEILSGSLTANPTTRRFAINGSNGDVIIPGNVSIGVTVPAGKLHVRESVGDEFYTKGNTDGIILVNNIASHGIGLSASQVGTYAGAGSVAIKLKEGGGVTDAGVISFIDDGVIGLVYKSGNLGIGTTTPTNKLSIDGGTGDVLNINGGRIIGLNNVPIDPSEAVPLSYLEDNYSQTASSLWSGTKNGNIWNGDSGTGNVGIGLSNPGYPLSVSGTIYATQIVGAATSLQSNLVTSWGSSSNLTLQSRTSTDIIFNTNGTSEAMRINSAGNVGIGTTNPDAKLQVQGTLKLQNVVSSSPDTNFRRMINVASYNGGGTYRTGILTVKLPSPLAHSMAKIKISGWSYGQAWDVIISGYLNTTQWTQVGGTVVTGNPPFDTDQIRLVADSASDTFYILLGDAATTYGYYASIGVDVDSIYSNNLPSTGWDIYIAASDPSFDYVSIPASSLYGSHGAVINNGNVYINDAVITSGTPKAAITKEYLTSTLDAFNSETNLWKLNGSSLYASTTNWNVGIGTTNPETLLHLKTTTNPSIIRLENSDTVMDTGKSYGNIQFYGNDINGGASGIRSSINAEAVGTTGQTVLTFYTSTGAGPQSEKVRIDNNGNVGIGTTTPTAKLTFGAATGNQIDVSGGRIIGLNNTPTEDSEAVPLKYLEDNYFAASSVEMAITSLFLTDSFYDGSFTFTDGSTGYDAGNQICNAASEGSHFCRTDEVVYLIQKNRPNSFSAMIAADPVNANGWIADGPPGYTGSVSADDCGGWKNSTSSKLGHFWIFDVDGGGSGALINCTTLKRITCCK